MSEWISVKDRLPEEGVRVLAFLRWGKDTARCIGLMKGGAWGDYSGGEWFSSLVTHWMPLPSDPT